MFAELTQRALDAEFDELYDERGNFLRKRVKTKEYWYYKRDEGGKAVSRYVGPVGDKPISDSTSVRLTREQFQLVAICDVVGCGWDLRKGL